MASTTETIHYPSSDGKPLAENMKQYDWIELLKGNIDWLIADDESFAAADNLIYPVRGNDKISTAPNVYVAIGRPKGTRPSYKVWLEGNIFPQVIFEVLSPSNDLEEMTKKRTFYEKYGCQEYYEIEPEDEQLAVWTRNSKRHKLKPVDIEHEWISPLLGVRFVQEWQELLVYHPTGELFSSNQAERMKRQQAERQVWLERQRAEAERQRAQQREAMLQAKLRELGIDPDSLQLP